MTTSIRVLIIEDSKVMLRALQRMVRENGFEPVEATTLQETQAALTQDGDFLCAIMDYNLPDAPNGETLPLLLKCGIPTIILTAINDPMVRQALLMTPIFDYVPKESPAAFEYVMKMVRRVALNPVIKVLVVDDSTSVRNYLHQLLKRQRYQVLEAPDAETALKLLKADPGIRLVLADHDMPGMDGMRMTSEIRRFFGYDKMAVIGVSGNEDPNMTARFIKAGADDYLQKPFNHEEFFCRVTRNIEFLENLEALARAANEDTLTHLPNRRYFFEQVLQRSGGYSVAMLDIDFFKSVNDEYGHAVGDAALCHLAALLREHFSDCLYARFGGEEFVVLLAGDELVPHLARLEAFRKKVQDTPVVEGDNRVAFTVSIGLAGAAQPSIDALLRAADDKLYEAKEHGRNRVCH